MFKAAFSQISSAGKLALLLLLIILCLVFSSFFGFVLLMPFLGTGVINALALPDYNDPAIVNALKAMQIINMTFGLLLPALIYLWLTRKPDDKGAALFRRPGWTLLGLAAVLVIFIQPFISYTNDVNAKMILPDSFSGMQNWMQNMEKAARSLTEAFLATTSWQGFLINLFMIALLPAFTEELVFRGVLARLFAEWTGNRHVAAVLSAIIFAGIHLQFYGFLPRFLLGLMLAYIFFWSGSLWVPIIAHLMNNLISVVVEFFYQRGVISINSEKFGFSDHILVVILSFILGCFIFYKFYLKKRIVVPEE